MKPLLLVTLFTLFGQMAAADATHLSHGRFRDWVAYTSVREATSFVLFLSGDAGWNRPAEALAEQISQHGAMVVGIDLPKFKAVLEADGAQCVFPDGDLENLSNFVQAYLHNSTYLAPLLVGIDSGGGMAYAVLAQAPKDTFAGALSLGFCPHLGLDKPICKGSGLELTRSAGGRGRGIDLQPIKSLTNPWVVLQASNNLASPPATTRALVSP